jgi:hypothetical protein
MTLRITIDIFSGRPNPTIVVTGAEEQELLGRLAAPPRLRAPAAKGRSVPPRIPPSLLGYRGIVVEQLTEGVRGKGRQAAPKAGGLPREFRIAGGFVHSPAVSRPVADANVEDFVCGSTGPVRLAGLGPKFPDFCLDEISRFRHILDVYDWRKIDWPIRPSCACAPLWEPAWWNDAGQVQWNNNCYNYGTNYRSDTYAQPGLASGAMYATISCTDVKAGAVADALIDAPAANNKCPKEGHLVALVVGPGWDFHWYRKGRNGYWTHKPGGGQATNRDNSGNLIADPRTADRGGYTSFCTFMVVMHGHVKVR